MQEKCINDNPPACNTECPIHVDVKGIIFEIRKDMGQKKSGLKQGDILAFFVNDIREYLPKNKRND